MAQQIITLNPGESKIVSFTVTPNEAKTYTVSVDGLGGTFVALPKGLPEVPEEFCVDTITAEPSVVSLGNEVKIHVQYWLPNGVDVRPYIGKTYQMHCTIDGETLTASTGPIPYFPADIYFAYTPRSVGTYTATVLDKSVSFEVRAEVPGPFYNPFGTYTQYATLDALAGFIAFEEGVWSNESAPGQNMWMDYINCPYCSAKFETGSYFGAPPYGSPFRLATTYALLDHIQSSHPDHPLTKPRCHIEVNVPEPPVTKLGINDYGPAYFINFDRQYAADHHPHTIWGILSWENIGLWIGGCYEFHNPSLFVFTLGAHHIVIRGPVVCRVGMAPFTLSQGLGVQTPDGSYVSVDTLPLVFDTDIVLLAVGDKVTIDAGTGLRGYHKWSVPVG